VARRVSDPFVFLFKKIIQNPVVWPKPYGKTQAWLWLLFEARYTDDDTLKMGELFASVSFLMNAWGWTQSKVRTFLKDLQANDMITIKKMAITDFLSHLKSQTKSHPKSRLISVINIVNFNEYQNKVLPKIAPQMTPQMTPQITRILRKNKGSNKEDNIYSEQRQLTDYIIKTYTDKYRNKPVVAQHTWIQISKLIKEQGAVRIKKAWDNFLDSDYFTQFGHPPAMFIKENVINRCLNGSSSSDGQDAESVGEYWSQQARRTLGDKPA